MEAKTIVCCGSHMVLEPENGYDPMDFQGKCEQCGNVWGLVDVTAQLEEEE